MKIPISVNHNYYEESPIPESDLNLFFHGNKSNIKSDLFSCLYELNTLNADHNKIQITGFKEQRIGFENNDQLILRLYSKESNSGPKNCLIQTGLYAGVIFHKGYKFNITSKYGKDFLRRMLNFLNNIYVDDKLTPASRLNNSNEFQFIIAYLFLQTLEKSALLGLPNEYQTLSQKSHKVRGKIDMNEYLRSDIPFKGKLTTSYREQVYIQPIVDVIYWALKKIEDKFGKDINRNLLGVKQLLKQNFSGRLINYETISAAKNHRILSNPIFSSFRKVLEYAEIIILNYDLGPADKDNKLTTTGFLFDISELFELYLEKLLRFHLKDWFIDSQTELDLYNKMFYRRKMYPDIIMKHKELDMVVVFDAKFKTMRLIKDDLDRSDFYQIHTYIQYFEPNVLFGGLIYPLSSNINIERAHSRNLLGLEKRIETKFLVDGIFLEENISMDNLIKNEQEFITRIKTFIEEAAFEKKGKFANL